MKTIYVLHNEWALNGYCHEGYVGIYENLEDAINRLEQCWEDEQNMDYFERFNEFESTPMTRCAWEDGDYFGCRSCYKIFEEQLYSHEDVENGLDL
jgi:protein-arginine kinase activator protein McsA